MRTPRPHLILLAMTLALAGCDSRIAEPRPRPERLHSIAGQPPSLIRPPEGCRFRPRCPHAFGDCERLPALEQRIEAAGHVDRCWLAPDRKRSLRMVEGQIGLEADVT